MPQAPTPDSSTLRAAFTGGTAEHVGLEVESGVVDPRTGRSRPYDGPRGTRALLGALLDAARARGEEAEPVTEDGKPIAVSFATGESFSLEIGGALEYSSTVHDSAGRAVAEAGRRLREAARVAEGLDLALLSGGFLPFTSPGEIPWIPKRRVPIMRTYFTSLGEDGALSDRSMGLTLSTQVTLDYLDAADLAEKVWAVNLASPVAAAMFVNSPLEDARPSGVLSRRMRCIQRCDPARFGVLPYAVSRPPTVEEAVNWALRLPMIYRDCDDGHRAAPPEPFDLLRRRGFGDGAHPTAADWSTHLDQLWTNVRVRDTLEARLCDGLSWPHFGAVAAFWTGLLYHGPSRRSVIGLLSHCTADDLVKLSDQVAAHGLAATLGARPVGDLCRELLSLARDGLDARVRAGLEPSRVPDLLDPLWTVLGNGRTFAEDVLARWHGDLGESPEAYVRAYRISSG